MIYNEIMLAAAHCTTMMVQYYLVQGVPSLNYITQSKTGRNWKKHKFTTNDHNPV